MLFLFIDLSEKVKTKLIAEEKGAHCLISQYTYGKILKKLLEEGTNIDYYYLCLQVSQNKLVAFQVRNSLFEDQNNIIFRIHNYILANSSN